jgi:hypothetical protein
VTQKKLLIVMAAAIGGAIVLALAGFFLAPAIRVWIWGIPAHPKSAGIILGFWQLCGSILGFMGGLSGGAILTNRLLKD